MMNKQFLITRIFIFFSLLLNLLPAKAHFTTKGPYGGSVTCLLATDTVLFVGTANGGVFRSTNPAATSWRYANYNGLTNASISSLAAIGQYVLAGTGNGIFRSNDAGNSWVAANAGISNKTVLSLITAGNRIITGTNGGGIYLSHDSGSTWEQSNMGLSNLVVTAFAFDGNTLYASTHEGVFSSTDDGDSWTPINTGLADHFVRSIAVSGNFLFVATPSGVFVSDKSSIGWASQNTGLMSISVNSLMTANGTVYASTTGGVYTFGNQNISWSAANTGYEGNVTTSVLYGGKLFAGTLEDGIYRSLSAETISWNAFNTGLNNLETFTLYNSGNLVITATNKGLFVSTDLAANYRSANMGLTDSLHITSLAMSGSTLYAATQNGGVFVSTDTGYTWAPVNNGLTVLNIQKIIATSTHLFVAAATGEVFSSELSSINWNANSGLPPAIIPTSMATDGSSHVFLGTANDGVFMCMDNQSWVASNSGLTNLNITSLAISGSTVFAGTLGGGVFKRNLMGNWSAAGIGLPSQYITALCASGPWIAAGFKGGVYVTYDNGISWKAPNVMQYIPEYADITEISFSPSSTRIFVATPYNCLYSNSIGELPTSISSVEPEEAGAILISPNPSNGYFTIAFKNIKTPIESVKIYNLTGEMVYELTDFLYGPDNGISVNMSAGIYFVSAQTRNGMLSKKVILN